MKKSSEHWYDEEPTLDGIREVDYDPLDYSGYAQRHLHARRFRNRQSCLMLVVLLIFIVAGFGGTLEIRSMLNAREQTAVVYEVVENETAPSGIAALFTPEVQYWADDIVRWAQEYNVDPNLVATVMQIESCGDPQAGSGAGAQGLFQVMPFHFTEGEVMLDINTNAKRGINYLVTGLAKAEGHVGLALAGYNGGHGMIGWGWARWPDETRRYHYWGTGIYYDAASGKPSSDRLNEWLEAGGAYLCNQAAQVQSALIQNSGG